MTRPVPRFPPFGPASALLGAVAGLAIWGAAVSAVPAAGGQAGGRVELACDLDPLLNIPDVWRLSPGALEEAYPKPPGANDNPRLKWLTRSKDRAVFQRRPFSNVEVALTILGGEVPVEEAVVDFVDGKLNGITFSVYNRGDGGAIAPGEFARREEACNRALRQRLGVVPSPRRAEPERGFLAEGWSWVSPAGAGCLERNPEAGQGHPAYLRLRIAPRDARGPIAAAIRQRQGIATLSQLAGNVLKQGDDVVIRGVPMIDQGPKGYCVVASVQRLFEYYGISCDQHQLAEIAATDVATGTSTKGMMTALERLDQAFRMQFKGLFGRFQDGSIRDLRKREIAGERDFRKEIERCVGEGVPLLWGLELGRFPEDPPPTRQASGNHMRLVIGYNAREILFTDSWGAGHELGRMAMRDAFAATGGLFVMQPAVR